VFGNDEIDEKTTRMSSEDKGILRLIQLDREAAAVAHLKVVEYLEKAQQRWNKTPPELLEDGPCFKPGEQVLLRNMRATANTMLPKYTGPYEVLQRKSRVTYEIKRPEPYFSRQNGKDIVHIDRLKMFNDPDPGGPVTPLFLQNDEEIEQDKELKTKIVEITPAGLETVVRFPPDTHTPVPMIGKHIINSLGQIEEDIEPVAVAAEEADLAAEDPDIDEIKITAAVPDTSPDPIQAHWDHKGPMTRRAARVLKVRLPEVFPFLKRWSGE
jgi:hypothetical protein